MSRLTQTLSEHVLIADGAMGSMIYNLAEPGFRVVDEVTLTQPDCVLGIHVRYLRAGANLIETNTFGANRIKLERAGLDDKVQALNSRAVKLAREAREIVGVDALIAGSIGPTGLRIRPSDALEAKLIEVFKEQALALDDRGVDLFMLETFSSSWELERAIRAVREVSGLPIIAAVTLPSSDEWSDDDADRLDELVVQRLQRLAALDADVLGINCTRGPDQMLPAVRYLARIAGDRPIAVQPNSGLPKRVGGRFAFPATSASYYAAFAQQAVDAGARLIGGCCGTTPEQIEAMAKGVASHTPSTRSETREPRPRTTEPSVPTPDAEPSGFQSKLDRGEFVVSVQVDPPKGTRIDMVLKAIRAFRDSGHVDVVDVNSNPMARLHMDALWMSAMIEAEGMETIAHYTPRDASLMGIEGNLLGAWNYGVRNVLVITGDPSVVNGEPGENDVYQTDSVGLVRTLAQLNDGVDCFGHTIGRPPRFNLGVAVNPNAEDLDLEVARFQAKVEAGARYAMTQVFFEWSCWDRFLERLGGRSPIPVLAAVWPLTSYRLAVRLHNEVPGIVVPDDVLQRLKDAGPKARAEGFALGRRMLAEARERVDGVYIIAPFKRPVAALELFED